MAHVGDNQTQPIGIDSLQEAKRQVVYTDVGACRSSVLRSILVLNGTGS